MISSCWFSSSDMIQYPTIFASLYGLLLTTHVDKIYVCLCSLAWRREDCVKHGDLFLSWNHQHLASKTPIIWMNDIFLLIFFFWYDSISKNLGYCWKHMQIKSMFACALLPGGEGTALNMETCLQPGSEMFLANPQKLFIFAIYMLHFYVKYWKFSLLKIFMKVNNRLCIGSEMFLANPQKLFSFAIYYTFMSNIGHCYHSGRWWDSSIREATKVSA